MALIIFDYDGVLMDSRNSWAHAFKKTAAKYNIHYTFDDIVKHFGPKTVVVLRELIDGDEAKVQEAKAFVDKLLWQEETLRLSKPAAGINGAAAELRARGHFLAILTNGDRAFMEASMDYHGLDKTLFEERIAAEDPYEKKEDAIAHLVEVSGAAVGQTYYIGDRVRDVEVARNAGCKSIIFVDHSWDTAEQIGQAAPDKVIHELDEMLEIVG